MADVKQKSGSFSLPLTKKPPSFNNNGINSSFKHIYDDIFGSSPSNKVKSSSSFMEDDYAEIFGSSKSSNECWSIPYSSVQILDLPKDKGNSFRGEKVDYGGVFGGFDDNGDGFGFLDGEELFDQLKKKPKTSSLNNLPRSQEQSIEATRPESSSQSYDGKLPANNFSHSFVNANHLEPENNKVTVKTTSKTRKATHNRVRSFQEPGVKIDPPNTDSIVEGKKGNHYRHISLDLGAQTSNSDSGLKKPFDISVTNLVDKPNVTNRPNKSPEKMNVDTNIGENRTPEIQPIPESTHSFDESNLVPDDQPIDESNQSLNELDSTQKTEFSETSMLNDPQTTNEVHSKSNDNCDSSLDFDSKLNENCDGTFPKPCSLTESTSADNSHESCEANPSPGPHYVVKDDDISFDSGKVKKKGRRSRMASIDLGDYKHSSEHDDSLKRKPRLGGSYSFDASHDPSSSRVKVHPSMMYPSSSLPRYFPVESRYKVSENSNGKCSPPSLIEELDVNSDAAISAALLEKAIEEAEVSIRLAKAYLKREGQGSKNTRFKDTLKVRVKMDNRVVHEVRKQTKLNECEERESCSPLETKNGVETAWRGPVFEDETKFVRNEKFIDRKDTKMSNSIVEDDKREGEWEPAKHFNQLISGVKNKLASFISWQTETEKKEVVMETEATTKTRQLIDEEIERDLNDREIFKRKRTANEVASTSSYEAKFGENKLRVDLEENEELSSLNVNHNKEEVSARVTTSLENFQFFAFRNHKVCDQEEEEKEPLETREPEILNREEQVVDEVETENIPTNIEEVSREESDEMCVTQDDNREDDTIKGVQNDEIVEEFSSLIDHGIKDFSVEDIYEDDTISKDDSISINKDKVEMMEEKTEPNYEDEQDFMSGKNEENNDLVEEPSSFSGHDEKGELPFEEKKWDDIYEEIEDMEESCTPVGHERNDVDHEMYNSSSSAENFNDCLFENSSEKIDEGNLGEDRDEVEIRHENMELPKETRENLESSSEYESQENDRDQSESDHFEEVVGFTNEREDSKHIEEQTELLTENSRKVNVQESCVDSVDDIVFSRKIEETSEMYDKTVHSCEPELEVESPILDQISSELHEEELTPLPEKSTELIGEDTLESTQKHAELMGEELELSSSSTEIEMEFDVNEIEEGFNGTTRIETLEREKFVELDSELDLSIEMKDVDVKSVDSESHYINNKFDDQTHDLHEDGENIHLEEFDLASVDSETSGVEESHRRRRWFDEVAERPSILEGKRIIELEIARDISDKSELAGGVEIHGDKLDSSVADVTTSRDDDVSSNPDIVRTNVETTPTRRKWVVKEEKPKPVSLFEDIKVNLDVPLEGNVVVDEGKGKQSVEGAPRRKRWFESGGNSQQVKLSEGPGLTNEIDQESKSKADEEEELRNRDGMSIPREPEKEHDREMDEVKKKGKEREKERIAVERAIREARERAFAEAKERARKEQADKTDPRFKVATGVQEKLGKVFSEASSLDKASIEAKLKAERAAVERATAEARERALQKALSEKGSQRSREQFGKSFSEKNFSSDSKNQTSRGSDSSNNEKIEGAYVESAMRRKARMERQTRTMERAAKALEEKNRRDLLAQKEQAAKNMMADTLDTEVKRWCTGKEGNLRALLSTLQYVLGPESGWQPVSLTELVASSAVRKAYKKATLCVHPDKLQQRGATIQQKYICEKVFDLLKDAWSKFNPDDR